MNSLTKVTFRKWAGFIFLILFCSYFGSITFFQHAHIIDGVTVVHSHPFKSQPGEEPDNHRHSKSGFLLIRIISSFIATVPIFLTGTIIIQSIPGCPILCQDNSYTRNLNLIRAVRPRAPAL